MGKCLSIIYFLTSNGDGVRDCSGQNFLIKFRLPRWQIAQRSSLLYLRFISRPFWLFNLSATKVKMTTETYELDESHWEFHIFGHLDGCESYSFHFNLMWILRFSTEWPPRIYSYKPITNSLIANAFDGMKLNQRTFNVIWSKFVCIENCCFFAIKNLTFDQSMKVEIYQSYWQHSGEPLHLPKHKG